MAKKPSLMLKKVFSQYAAIRSWTIMNVVPTETDSNVVLIDDQRDSKRGRGVEVCDGEYGAPVIQRV